MLHYYLVAPATVVRADEFAFTYHYALPLKPGAVVRIFVGKRPVNGVVLQRVSRPTFTTKPIDSVLASLPIPIQLISLSMWLADFYATHFGLVLQTVLPAGLHKTRRLGQKTHNHPIRKRAKIVLNHAQSSALQQITASNEGTFLLHGITGSGKTQVYIEAAKYHAAHGRSSILLVPEIALTPQLVAEFAHHFNNLVVTHSGMGEAQRHLAWTKVLQATEPTVVIGPRSALFMPLTNVGLFVIDECHEPSYKQEQTPRYSALRAASVLAKQHRATLVLGSATPSVADYYLATKNANPIIELSTTARASKPVEAKVIDLKRRDLFRRHRFFSDTLLARLSQTLEAGHQSLLFHNRRGTAPTTICEHCGWLAECPTCYLPLTLHADKHILSCHLCAYAQPIPPACPICSEPTITFKGIGTKLIEAEIKKIFPKARVARFDADTAPADAVHNRYQDLYDGTIDILVGTQMLAKGLDLPKLATVGVIQADSGLILPDYPAEERVFQLLYQVMGRVGRGQLPGHVIVQSYQPDHPTIKTALARDYQTFYTTELAKRRDGRWPPFRHLLKLSCSYKTEAGAIRSSLKMAHQLRRAHPTLEVLGPTPAFHERLGGTYRWQLIIKSTQRRALVDIANNTPAGWTADLDPASLL